MQYIFLSLSNLLIVVSYIIYTLSILKGESKPHRTTRLVLLIINSLSTASLFAQKNQVAIWLPGISTLCSLIIFYLTLKNGIGGWSKTDIFCLIIALIGIIFWQITQNPVVAMYFAIGADFTGMVPALIKTYKLPHTESFLFFFIGGMAAFLNLLATKVWTFQNYSYPLYITLICIVMLLLISKIKFSRNF